MQKSVAAETPAIPVLWTGGVESTFRVLDLVIHHQCAVQPIYVIPEKRNTTEREIAAMEDIRAAVAKKFPELAPLMKETRYIHQNEIHVPDPIRQQHAILRSKNAIVGQYEWLAAVASNLGYDTVEVGIQLEDTVSDTSFIRKHAVAANHPCGAPTYSLPEWEPIDDYETGMLLYRNFNLPVLYARTSEMDQTASQFDFQDIFTLTWTCQLPIGDEPCGMCNICTSAIKAGKEARYPKSALLRYRFRHVLHPARIIVSNPKGAADAVFRKLGALRK